MKRFVEGDDRKQVTLLPECLDDFVAEDNPVRIVEAFVEELELEALGFFGVTPSTTGRLSRHHLGLERHAIAPAARRHFFFNSVHLSTYF